MFEFHPLHHWLVLLVVLVCLVCGVMGVTFHSMLEAVE